jgi:hypothetical protein
MTTVIGLVLANLVRLRGTLNAGSFCREYCRIRSHLLLLSTAGDE